MKSQTWFEQKIENIQSLLNQYFPKFSNSENKWCGKIKNTHSFANQNTAVVDSRTILESKTIPGGISHV